MARGMDMQSIMRQAQKMQADVARVQEELKETMVEGVAGGGAVKVTASCANQICGITISPDAVDPEDVEMLEDMIMAAINDAMSKAGEIANSRMGAVTNGLKLPF